MTTSPLLECQNLKKYFDRRSGLSDLLPGRNPPSVQAVDGVSFTLHKKESIGVIGESGCGKTTLLKTLIGLHEPTDGEIYLDGRPVSEFDRKDWKEYRRRVQVIFQDPFNSLDPKMSVRSVLKEPLKIHDIGNHDERIQKVLKKVELQPPEKYLYRRPNQLSGGEKQRVSIARALVLEPDVILADEPASMLDVSTQAAILKLLSQLMEETDVSMIYISHDLSTVSYICDTIKVMYLGRAIEEGPTRAIISDPKHPYTQALIHAIPLPDPHEDRPRTEMEGAPRDPIGLGEGCRFRDRCPDRMPVCDVTPDYVPIQGSEDSEIDRYSACHLYYDHEESPSRNQERNTTNESGGEDQRGRGK